MKKLVLIIAIAVLGIAQASAQSENYKAFKVDLGMLYGLPSDGFDAGIGFYVEPKYNLTDNIALGLKMEWAVLGAEESDGLSASISALGSYQVTGDYYFGTNKVRPFVGLGTGIYSMGSVDYTANTLEGTGELSADYGSKFGLAPRAGLLLGHFRLGLEYNIITGIPSELASRNYMSIKIGFEIGGGKK
nr:outer membrane beta-barrel protein [uncultured Carboxylicivirga sp.]